jgi:two-component system sensor histidine kinase YesM
MGFPVGGSIRKKLKASYAIIIAVMLVIPITTIASSLIQSARYDHMILNVSKTNRINQIVKTEIANELWDVVAGSKKFDDAGTYATIKEITDGLAEIKETTEVKGNRQLLEVAGRAMETLTSYVDRLRFQEQFRYPVSDNEKILEEIRGVSALVSDILQDFIVLEIESAARTNESIKIMVWTLVLLQIMTVVCVTLFAAFAQRSVSRSINSPIKRLETLSTRIASGDLDARATSPQVEELDNLTENLNSMAAKIKDLIQANIREQQNLQKSEMKALQAQITPHFLYNTLDTIIWLAETNDSESVIAITRALSNFFRVSLSRGNDWITVAEEISHVQSYLTIQRIRYRDILDYTIEADPEIEGRPMLKLLLQPLVENALYHGIKNKRARGSLCVRAWKDDGFLAFSVQDDGIGMTAERLADIRAKIEGESDKGALGDVYGLYNVTRRLRLYYNGEAELRIESAYGEGTVVTFRVPEEVAHV